MEPGALIVRPERPGTPSRTCSRPPPELVPPLDPSGQALGGQGGRGPTLFPRAGDLVSLWRGEKHPGPVRRRLDTHASWWRRAATHVTSRPAGRDGWLGSPEEAQKDCPGPARVPLGTVCPKKTKTNAPPRHRGKRRGLRQGFPQSSFFVLFFLKKKKKKPPRGTVVRLLLMGRDRPRLVGNGAADACAPEGQTGLAQAGSMGWVVTDGTGGTFCAPAVDPACQDSPARALSSLWDCCLPQDDKSIPENKSGWKAREAWGSRYGFHRT